MPQKQTSPLRVIIPLIVLLAGIGVAVLAANRGGTKPPPTPAGSSSTPGVVGDPGVPAGGVEELVAPDGGEPEVEAPVESSAEAAPVAALGGLRARTYETQPDLPVLGSLDEASDYEIGVELSPFGLGIESLRLTDYYETLGNKEHILVQATQPMDIAGSQGTAVPFALTAVFVNGERVDLTSGPRGEPVWRNLAGVGAFEAVIEDEAGTPVLRIERTVTVKDHSHDVRIRQRAANLTDAAINLSWVHSGPLSLDPDSGGYGGDKRRLRFGYWLNAKSQAGDTAVLSDRYTTPFVSLLNISKEGGGYVFPTSRDIWPNKKSDETGDRLVWIGLTDRYFGVAMHQVVDPAGTDRLMRVSRITRVAGLKPGTPANAKRAELANNAMVLMLVDSEVSRVEPGASSSFDLGLFAGPLSIPVINGEPLPKALGLAGLVLYNFGGLCAFCTFQPLTHLLLGVLHVLHGVTGDWALAIIILVILVRSCLHPVTRWSQIKMQRFGAQMQAIAPKQAKLKEKYKDDPKRLQAEMTKLWREEGINPAGMLGCLPMMLQSPVWIALYATLFFAVELRHQPGFYGIFQSFGGWQFLADLSRSDNAIPLGRNFDFGIIHIDAINILPIIMGFVFYFHQKYLTPPTATTMTPEQESQQKFIKIAMIFLFPVMMYAAPSGLALYFVTNSTLAIIENKWIRAHMNKHGLLDADKIRERIQAKREARKDGGFVARLQKAAAEQQGREQASKRMMRRVKNTAPERSEPNFKKKKPKK